jgi:hypothetical protein
LAAASDANPFHRLGLVVHPIAPAFARGSFS